MSKQVLECGGIRYEIPLRDFEVELRPYRELLRARVVEEFGEENADKIVSVVMQVGAEIADSIPIGGRTRFPEPILNEVQTARLKEVMAEKMEVIGNVEHRTGKYDVEAGE